MQFDPSQRIVALSTVVLRPRREEEQTKEIVVYLEKLSSNELYRLQHETQLELCDREGLIHNELQLVR